MADAETQSEFVQGSTRAGRDRGFSIVEVVVTITLMAMVLVPIMSAVVMSIRASSQGRSASEVETTLVNAADRVNRATKRCDYLPVVRAAVQTRGWNPDLASVTQERYVPGATPAEPGGGWIAGACELNTAPAAGLVQRVIITITSPDGHIQREIQVVKGRV